MNWLDAANTFAYVRHQKYWIFNQNTDQWTKHAFWSIPLQWIHTVVPPSPSAPSLESRLRTFPAPHIRPPKTWSPPLWISFLILTFNWWFDCQCWFKCGVVKGYQAVTPSTTPAYQRASTVPLNIWMYQHFCRLHFRFAFPIFRHFSFPHFNLTCVWSLLFIASANHVLCDSTTALPLSEVKVFPQSSSFSISFFWYLGEASSCITHTFL